MNDKEIRASMTSEQIQLERKLTCEAIDGAMAFGYQNMNPPPSDEHWLAPFWKIGRKQAELEERIAASASAEPVYQRKIKDGTWVDTSLLGYENWPEDRRRILYASPRPIEAPAQAVALSAINAAYVDWDLVERMRCGEEIDSEEAGMIGAMIDSQAREIEALRAALSADKDPK